jgi:hypothetical protein
MTRTNPVMPLTRIEIRIAIAKITAVVDSDWIMGVGSIGAIGKAD